MGEPAIPSERLLAVKEAAEWLGVSTWTLYQLARSQEIRSVKVGRQVRFREAWLTAYAEANATGPEVVDGERVRSGDGLSETGRHMGGDVGAATGGRKAAKGNAHRRHRGWGVEADAGGAADRGTVELAIAAADRKRRGVSGRVAT